MTSPVAVLTDSSAQLPEAVAAAHGIRVVPIPIVIDGDEIDEPDVEPARFWRALETGAKVTTSAPSPGVLAAAYERLHTEGASDIVSVHVDSRVSASVSAAHVGAEESAAAVRVVDTGQTSFGVALCALEARRALDEGATAEEAEAKAIALGERLENAFVVGTGVGGRLGVGSGTVLSFADGAPEPLGRAEDADEAIAAIVRRVSGRAGPLGVAVGHAHPDLEPSADALEALLGRLPSVVETLRYRVGPSVAAHTGPWSFGAFFWRVHP